MGKVGARGRSMWDIKKSPSVDFFTNKDKRVTRNEHMYGRVAATLNAQRYGKAEW